MLPFSRRAFQTALEGQTVPQTAFSRDKPKSGAPTLKRFCPQGKQRRSPHTGSVPLPAGQGSVAQRMPLQAAGSCSWACRRLLLLPLQPKRNAAPMPPTRGAWARLHGAEGAGRRHCRLGRWARVAPLAPAEQGIAAPALKTLVFRLFFPLYAVLPVLFCARTCNRTADAFPPPLLRERNDRTGGEMTLPCPTGKGRCRCAYSTLFAPAGQKRFRVGAPDFGDIAERVESWGALPIRNGRQARRGTGKVPRRFTILRICKIQLFAPSARPISPGIPQGERRALPAPAQGIHPLRIPFWGNGSRFPAAPHLQNAAGGKPLLVGLPPSIPSIAPFGPKRSTPAPFVTGRVCVYLRPKALAAGTAGNGGG